MENYASTNDIEHLVSRIFQNFGNVENKSASTILGELTSQNVIDALGYTPENSESASNEAFRQDGVMILEEQEAV